MSTAFLLLSNLESFSFWRVNQDRDLVKEYRMVGDALLGVTTLKGVPNNLQCYKSFLRNYVDPTELPKILAACSSMKASSIARQEFTRECMNLLQKE